MSGEAEGQSASPALDTLCGLHERVSARGDTYLEGQLSDGRRVFVFTRKRIARDGSSHALAAAAAPPGTAP